MRSDSESHVKPLVKETGQNRASEQGSSRALTRMSLSEQRDVNTKDSREGARKFDASPESIYKVVTVPPGAGTAWHQHAKRPQSQAFPSIASPRARTTLLIAGWKIINKSFFLSFHLFIYIYHLSMLSYLYLSNIYHLYVSSIHHLSLLIYHLHIMSIICHL